MGMTDALGNADNGQKLLIEVTVGQLKTISAGAVVRQARMRKVANEEADARNWEIHDAAVKEAERSYEVEIYAERLLQSLVPDRIEDEWFEDSTGRLWRRKDHEYGEAETEVSEGYPVFGSSGS